MKAPKMAFSAAGDMLIQRLISTEYDGFKEVKQHISKADARFFNFESIIYRDGLWGNQFNGGSYHNSHPKTLEIAKEYGFNMLSFANNHTFDFGYGGLESTLEAVTDAGFVHAGVGRNMDEAAAPAYLDTPNGRVALISITTSMVNQAAMAGRQSRRLPGRPGLNGLRISEHIEVTPEQFEVIEEVIRTCGINDQINISRAEGYTQSKIKDGVIELGKKINFHRGEKAYYHAAINEKDMARIQHAIMEAKSQADYILVSVHSHQVTGTSKETPPDFLTNFAHRCIEMGAHAVLGHGPHLLRPIEIYQNRPIFYSLGDFMLHNESVTFAPEDMYEKYSLTSDDLLSEIYRKRSRDYTCGLLTDHRMLESVVPYFEMEDGKLTHLELMPIELGFDKPRYRMGDPQLCTDHGIIERLQALSEPYGTKITLDDRGFGVVALD